MIGGAGFDDYGNSSALNGVWKFNAATDEWTWVGGSSEAPMCFANWDSCGVGAVFSSFWLERHFGNTVCVRGIYREHWRRRRSRPTTAATSGSFQEGLRYLGLSVVGSNSEGDGSMCGRLSVTASDGPGPAGTAPNSPGGTCGIYGELGNTRTGKHPRRSYGSCGVDRQERRSLDVRRIWQPRRLLRQQFSPTICWESTGRQRRIRFPLLP